MSVLVLLAPSKTMDTLTTCPISISPLTPLFTDQAARIVRKIALLSPKKIMQLMAVSLPIAVTVQKYYAAWQSQTTGKPAIWTYTGDVYKGFQAVTMSLEDADWAQQHIVISSGLYGLLRPYDGVQAYRLEMKTALSVGGMKNLSEFWTEPLASYIAKRSSDWLCNCSSEEYAKPVLKNITLPVITPVFFDTKPNGAVSTVPIYSKIMRGVFARWMVDKRIENLDQLPDFQAHDYSYNVDRSKPNFPAFSRAKMVPLRFN